MDARFSYREAAVRGASREKLVVLLYEQMIEDLRRAVSALERRDVEERTREINHAILVLAHLENSLDKERGGVVARNLERFYEIVRQGLVEAQCQQSGEGIKEQIELLMLVRDAWLEVDRASAVPSGNGENSQATAAPFNSLKWRA